MTTEKSYLMDDWVPLFREPFLSNHPKAVEIPDEVIGRYFAAKTDLINAAADLEKYDPERRLDN